MHNICFTLALLLAWLAGNSTPASADQPATNVRFKKQVLTGEYHCDGVAAGDINSDGHPDVVAGPFWFAGPDFEHAHEIYPPLATPRAASPSDSLFSFVHDFDGDQDLDVLVLGRVHKHPAYWYENPGDLKNSRGRPSPGPHWAKHYVFERIRGESPVLCDLNGDGVPQLICHWEGRWGYLQPVTGAPTNPWQFTAIGDRYDWPQFYHGTGIGDLNDDGRLDVIINDGWYEQPPLELASNRNTWAFHPHRFSPQRGGAQMFAVDVDDDGDSDVISSLHAHAWGLAWFEQLPDDAGFQLHKIMGDRQEEPKYGVAFSQPHALEMADINGDGRSDIVVGKRRWAHGPTGDVEPAAPPVVYWFESQVDPQGKPSFLPHLIDDASGVGTQICVADLNHDDRPDILTASKLGVFAFLSTVQ